MSAGYIEVVIQGEGLPRVTVAMTAHLDNNPAEIRKFIDDAGKEIARQRIKFDLAKTISDLAQTKAKIRDHLSDRQAGIDKRAEGREGRAKELLEQRAQAYSQMEAQWSPSKRGAFQPSAHQRLQLDALAKNIPVQLALYDEETEKKLTEFDKAHDAAQMRVPYLEEQIARYRRIVNGEQDPDDSADQYLMSVLDQEPELVEEPIPEAAD